MKTPKYTEKQIADTLTDNSGFMNATANQLGIRLRTLYKYLDRFPDLKDLRAELDDRILDDAEIKLLHAVEEGNLTAIIFLLKTKGFKRGYNEYRGKVPENAENANKSVINYNPTYTELK